MAKRPALPQTKLGQWALLTLGTALVLGMVTMGSAFSAMQLQDNVAYNFLGYTAPVFLLLTVVGVVLSWLAVFLKKDRSLVLLIIAIVVTAAALFTLVAEIIEANMMANG